MYWVQRFERRSLAMRRVATPPALLAAGAGALATAAFDPWLTDLLPDLAHILIRAYIVLECKKYRSSLRRSLVTYPLGIRAWIRDPESEGRNAETPKVGGGA